MPALSTFVRNNVIRHPAAAEPESARMLLARARNAAFAEAARGNLGQGLGILQDAMDDEPVSHELQADMAALLLVAGRLDQAAQCAERALQIQPHHGPSLYTLGFALSGLGRRQRAIEVLSELKAGPGRDNLLDGAPDLLPVAMQELERLQRA